MSRATMGYLRVLFAQFTPLRALRELAARVTRALWDPHCVPSYGQTGEDRIIEAYFPNLGTGFYVDVGCNEPVRNSNTFKLYRRGWRGINIDANAALIASFAPQRPRDCNVRAIVSDVEQDMTLDIYADSLFSTVSAERRQELEGDRAVVRRETTRSRRLTQILDEQHAPAVFEVLSVDVEGHDLQVLKSLDLQRYQPTLIVVEMHGFDLAAPVGEPVYDYLVANGYKLASYAVMNGYFLRVNAP